jgi:hypothetical protein
MRFESAPLWAFRFDEVQGGKLTSGIQKHRVKDLFPWCNGDWRPSGKAPTFEEKSNTLSR